MDSLKKTNWNVIATSVLCMALGVVLAIFPQAVNEMITYVISASMFILSIISFYNFFKKNIEINFYRNDLVYAVITLVIGIFVLAKRELIISLIPTVLGIIVIISGVKKLQNAIDLLRIKLDGWLAVLVLALINIIFGVIMVIFSSKTATVITILIGVGLIFSGATDIFSALWVNSRAKKCEKEEIEEQE